MFEEMAKAWSSIEVDGTERAISLELHQRDQAAPGQGDLALEEREVLAHLPVGRRPGEPLPLGALDREVLGDDLGAHGARRVRCPPRGRRGRHSSDAGTPTVASIVSSPLPALDGSEWQLVDVRRVARPATPPPATCARRPPPSLRVDVRVELPRRARAGCARSPRGGRSPSSPSSPTATRGEVACTRSPSGAQSPASD